MSLGMTLSHYIAVLKKNVLNMIIGNSIINGRIEIGIDTNNQLWLELCLPHLK